jgi:DNA-directed RNA polymerase subunit F
MGKRELSENRLALPQVKKVLEAIGEENLDQFQRRTLDYVNKFSKLDAETVDELRVFLAGGRKIIETVKLDAIVSLLNDSRAVK